MLKILNRLAVNYRTLRDAMQTAGSVETCPQLSEPVSIGAAFHLNYAQL